MRLGSRNDAAPTHPVPLPPVLREFCVLTAILTVLSALYCIGARLFFHLHYPYDWPLFVPSERFGDFTIYQQKFTFFHQLGFFTHGYPFTYPSTMALFYEVLYQLPGAKAVYAFLFVLAAGFLLMALLFARKLRDLGLSASTAVGFAAFTLFCSWPLALLIDRANVEIFVCFVLATAVWAYATGREWTAASLFGFAAALKLFPFVYLGLFLHRRKFPKIVLGAAVFALLMLVSLALLGPTVLSAYRGIAAGLDFFRKEYVEVYNGDLTGLDHSLLGLTKTFIVIAKHKRYEGLVRRVADLYTPITAVIGVVLYIWRIRKLPWLNQLLVFTIVAVLFTPFSGDGTLIHLYYAFALFCFLAIDAFRRGLHIPGLRLAMLCFAFLFSVESFAIAQHRRVEAQPRCLVLIVLLVLAMRFPFSTPLEQNAEPEELSEPDARRLPTAHPA